MLKPTTPQVHPSGDHGASHLALRELFDQDETALLRYAFSFVGRREVAEEIVQDVFLQLHARWNDVDAPKAWLFRTVRNRALNFLRDSRRETLDGRADHESATGCDDNPEALVQRTETLASLRSMLNELAEPDQQLVKMKYFESLKYREISERTGLSVGNVGYRLHHILKELASKLRPLGIDGNS